MKPDYNRNMFDCIIFYYHCTRHNCHSRQIFYNLKFFYFLYITFPSNMFHMYSIFICLNRKFLPYIHHNLYYFKTLRNYKDLCYLFFDISEELHHNKILTYNNYFLKNNNLLHIFYNQN